MRKKSYLFFFVLIAISCTNSPSQSSPKKSKALSANSYTYDLKSDIDKRIFLAPDFLVKFINDYDKTDKYTAYTPSSMDLELISEYFKMMPEKYQELLKKKLVGMFLINNFDGGGMTEVVFDQNNKPLVIIILNPLVLTKSLSEWMTYRDSSPFISSDSFKIETVCNTSYRGLLHTLIHESSHVFDFYNHVSGGFDSNNQSKKYQFTDGIWSDVSNPVQSFDIPNRKNVKAYNLGGKINIETAVEIYTKLKETPFSSLYAIQNVTEDFAEEFSWFYLKEKYNIFYEVRVIKENTTLFIYKPYANSLFDKRIAKLKEIIE